MFYFMYGDTPLLLKYEELVKKIKKENPGIPVKIYDASQGEEENFLEAISINSMFSSKELIILKRVEKLKKLEKFLKIVDGYDLIQKEVIVIYEEELNDFGKPSNEVEKKVLGVAEKIGKLIVGRKATEKKGLHFFIEKELGISEYESEKLTEILGDDFSKVKNEVEKIKNYLDGKKFVLEAVLPILTVSEEYNIKKLMEEFMVTDNKIKLLDHLKKTREHMLFLYLLSEEITIALKLNSLKNIGELRESISYNNFKGNTYENIKNFFKNSRGYMKEYPIFLKLKYIGMYDEKFLIKKIDEILKIEYAIKIGELEEEIAVEKFIRGFKK